VTSIGLFLWDELAQATDNKQLEVAERIVYFDGRWDFTELSSSQLIAGARRSSESELKKALNLTIFHDERQQGGRDHDPGQDLHKANRMAAIAHDGQKDHSGQDTTGLD
jgi:hypothetical protein